MNERRQRPHARVTDGRRREDRLDELLAKGSRNFRAYRRRAYIAFAVLTVANVIAFAWIWSVANSIQTERKASIRRACVEQNMRHDLTIARLDQLIARVPPERRRRAREGRPGTVLLIEALAPKRDCGALVESSVNVK